MKAEAKGRGGEWVKGRGKPRRGFRGAEAGDEIDPAEECGPVDEYFSHAIGLSVVSVRSVRSGKLKLTRRMRMRLKAMPEREVRKFLAARVAGFQAKLARDLERFLAGEAAR